METPGRRRQGFEELTIRALRYLSHDVEPRFQGDKLYGGASKYEIDRALGHTQHLDTVNDIMTFLCAQGWARVSTTIGRATYYRATDEGIIWIGKYYSEFSDLFVNARKMSRTRRRP